MTMGEGGSETIWVWIAVGGIFTFIGWFWREVYKAIEGMEYDEEGWYEK